jgi:ABC-type Fe3+-hydroxamate transport system substrate-binding protein
MFRLYAQYDYLAVRTARRYSQLEKAAQVAATIQAKYVEIRQLLPDVLHHHVVLYYFLGGK